MSHVPLTAHWFGQRVFSRKTASTCKDRWIESVVYNYSWVMVLKTNEESVWLCNTVHLIFVCFAVSKPKVHCFINQCTCSQTNNKNFAGVVAVVAHHKKTPSIFCLSDHLFYVWAALRWRKNFTNIGICLGVIVIVIQIVEISECLPENVVITSLDLASFASVRSCAEKVLASESRLDILVNNAGIVLQNFFIVACSL